ncbi:MAG TPA: ABC transporter permease subunit [Candidatus Limnocylindrales bacterium]|nr:ABC transporter permease subunit [Candidatus Limnocylindrales bacterium]
MIASYRADTLKIRKRTANWILLAVLLLILVFLDYVVGFIVLKNPPPGFRSTVPASTLIRETYPENLVPNVISGMLTIGAAILLIFGALSTASEFGWLTVQTILVQGPTRRAVLAGKILALAVVSLLVTIILFAAAALTSYLLVTISGVSSSWPAATTLLRGMGATWFILGVYTAFGMALGVVFRSTAAAIGGGLTYVFVVEGILGLVLGNADWAKEILKFLPGEAATAVSRLFPYSFTGLEQRAPLIDGTRGLITLGVYLVAFLVISLVVFDRRDVGA